jgi:hypothetical protein
MEQDKLVKKTVALLIVPLLFLMWLPQPVQAQEPELEVEVGQIDWRELKTENFIIVYAQQVEIEGEPVDCICGVEEAERYATFVDEVYHDLSVVFETELATPINLRLFPTEESYYQVNPIARQLTGVVAHALNTREEIAIAAPRTQQMTEEQLVNNIRHELTHFFASLLSDGKLTAGFQEGVAQYLEKPGDQSGGEPALLRQALEQNRLMAWAELDEAQEVYTDPQVAYPQSLSLVSFLVERYTFPAFLEFLRVSAQETGYRGALEAAYGKSADELETEWLAYLPEYLDGRWKINAIYAYDLDRVTALVENGAYTDAESELTEIITLLETTDQTDTLAQAEALLAQTHQGQAARALADESRLALQASDYAGAIAKGNAAIEAYESLGYRNRIHEIQVYIHRAELGQEALRRLGHGERQLEALRFLEADSQIYEATVLLQSLDNQAAARRGNELLTQSAWKQSLLAYALLAVGLALLLFNALRRVVNRYRVDALEVEFS